MGATSKAPSARRTAHADAIDAVVSNVGPSPVEDPLGRVAGHVLVPPTRGTGRMHADQARPHATPGAIAGVIGEVSSQRIVLSPREETLVVTAGSSVVPLRLAG